jgi:hypothetical protein
MRSGSSTRSTRGTSSTRARSQARKEQTPALDAALHHSRSVPRSGRSRTVKPYEGREGKKFNDVVWDLARRWFVLALWRENCFFLEADQQATVNRCATEAYETAISQYRETYPGEAALIPKFRLQPQCNDHLIQCRQHVSRVFTVCVVPASSDFF